MKYIDNRSQVWFKVLDQYGHSIDEETTYWSLPKKEQKGQWTESLSPCGTMLTSNLKDFLRPGYRAFVVEMQGEPIMETQGLIWVKKLRLVREATNLDLKRFGIYRAFAQIV